ncbi:hypothetical protein CLV72_11267 [Allonocardiopsis opalescens]|uniref:Uncharacterized protein n=2 Tax=Allonocardiopsis opalescens TaxID=1144618 RepID=A0A2T0PSW5_9ACTN|nr:hypothetical protein CLV72_11267 [Allonocardiopsis opalescens]
MIIGRLPDGNYGELAEGGAPVGAPTAPTVTPSLGGLRITWDGALADADAAVPGDFDHMAVHISTSSGFVPSAATYVGTIRRAGEGGMLPVVPLPYVPHYVALVPVNTSGIPGTPSAEVAATPLQVTAPDITAGSIHAVHIAAGAVEADKLEAVLALVTTIIAGIPGEARVELDQDGLRGYNEANELIFAVDSSGNAIFSGNITGSVISGSSMQVGQAPGATGITEASGDAVYNMVTAANNSRAQIRADSSQAEFSAFSDAANPNAPSTGFIAAPTHVSFVLNSDNAGGSTPAVAGSASPTQAFLAVRSEADDLTAPRCDTVATAGSVTTVYQAASGAGMRLRADGTYSVVEMTTPPSGAGNPPAGFGSLYALRRSTDVPALQLQSPASTSGAGQGLRSAAFIEGATTTRPYARIQTYARDYDLSGQILDDGTQDTANHGRVALASNLSISAPRHEPVSTALLAQPTTASPSNGAWVDFTEAQFPALAFTTAASGLVEIKILFCGINKYTDTSSLALGFRLSGGSTVAASLKRCALIRSTGTGTGSSIQASATLPPLALAANTAYTLTPQWRTSGSAVSSPVQNWTTTSGDLWIDTALENSITVEPLM